MLTEILEKYRDKKPMDFGIATEVVYPVSSVIRMMEEYHKCKVIKLRLGVVSNRSKTKKVSSDGVFFRCDNCGFEPQMKSSTDDLLIMHFCPKCGSEFE